MEDFSFDIKCRKYLTKRLGTLLRDIEKTVQKEKGVRADRVKTLTAYQDLGDAQDAFGYGEITEGEYDEIRDVLATGADFIESITPKSAALDMLKEYIGRLKSDIHSLEWEMRPPEEQERILKAQTEFREKHGLKKLN